MYYQKVPLEIPMFKSPDFMLDHPPFFFPSLDPDFSGGFGLHNPSTLRSFGRCGARDASRSDAWPEMSVLVGDQGLMGFQDVLGCFRMF